MESSDGLLGEIMARAKAEPALEEIQEKFAHSGIQSWIHEEEQTLLFGVGCFAPGRGRMVEIGSFQGGSSCFLAAGLKRRGQGRLTCIDPFLGGPPWLGMAPQQHTLKIFRNGIKACGVEDWVDARVGDSAAVAAIWPSEPVDVAFIDGDHSFLGALRDFESWLPKVVPGGWILIDNATDPGCPGVIELVELIKTLSSVRFLGAVGKYGNAVFLRNDVPLWEALDELSRACAAKGVFRPWDMTMLHAMDLPPNYLKSKDWTDPTLDIPYQLAFLARCGAGDYGYTASSRPADRALLRALCRDRGDGKVIELGGMADKIRNLLSPPSAHFRVILCAPEEAKLYAPRLLPGGLLLASLPVTGDHEVSRAGLNAYRALGIMPDLIGGRMIHGVWQPHLLTSETILASAMASGGPGVRPQRKAS
jgi:predicted O-methyltransferase YrrM